MQRYKLTRTLKDFQKRLAQYPPSALREVKRAMDKIEIKHGIVFEAQLDAIDVAEKELLIAQYEEMGATDAEIDVMLRRWGFL
jgi:hypothetical protein